MVLKIAGNDGWKFIDGIKEVFMKKISIDKWEPREYDDVFLYYHSLLGETGKGIVGIKRNDGYDESVDRVVEVTVKLENNEYKVYIADLAVYLLSNEGKTIERIN